MSDDRNGSPLGRIFGAVREAVKAGAEIRSATRVRKCINCPNPVQRALSGEQSILCEDCRERARGVAVGLAGKAFVSVLDALTKEKR